MISGVDVPYTNDGVRAGGKDLLAGFYLTSFVFVFCF